MNKLEFNFSDDCFNRLFPFYILIDESLQITNFGESLAKICPFLEKSASFVDNFIITRPHLENPSFEELVLNTNQLTVIKSTVNDISIRGQFEKQEKSLLFVGSPWFNSMHDVVEKKLTLHDFALHDPLIDLLHVLNNQENTSKELKDLLMVVNNQKNKLKKDGEELNRLSLVASANENGVVFTTPDGIIFWCNESFIKLTGFSKEEVIGKTPIEVGKCELTDSSQLSKMTIPFYKGEPFDIELIHGRKDGSSFWTKTKGQPILNTKGEVIQYFAMIEDISLSKKFEENLKSEKAKYQNIIANMNLGLLEVDKKGKILLANQSFCKMSGYSLEELKGKEASDLLLAKESQELMKSKDAIRENGQTDSYEVKVIDKNHQQKYWLISGAPNYDINGKIIGSIGIHLNITEQKELESQREFLVSSLAKSNKELEDYASIVSHDLKSPLRSIHSLISWIKEDNDKEFSEQTLQYLSMVENKVEKMDYLIEGILTYAKIDKIDQAVKNVNTQEIIQNIINIIHIPSHIIVKIKNNLPTIKADRFRIQQLFQNLISNAVNYIDKPTGSVIIDCSETSKHYIFSIQDNGPGIAKQNQEKIFKIFQSLETSDKSTGLGLSIVKKIIETYDGEIWIESKMGKGTTFFIKLPIKH